MNREQVLAEIEKAQQATPGPWEVVGYWLRVRSRRLAGFNIGSHDQNGRSEGHRNLEMVASAGTNYLAILRRLDAAMQQLVVLHKESGCDSGTCSAKNSINAYFGD